MNRQLSTEEVELLERTILAPTVMTRREKLLRFAHVIRQSSRPNGPVMLNDRYFIFNNLEYMDDATLARCSHPFSAFAAAAADPVLQDAGLKGDDGLSIKRFFELSTNQLHEFSCDCGGTITNEEMARRVERMAG